MFNPSNLTILRQVAKLNMSYICIASGRELGSLWPVRESEDLHHLIYMAFSLNLKISKQVALISLH